MSPLNRRSWLACLVVAGALGATLRGVWLTADPPSHPSVGVAWHDEGAYVHNARNRALWGVWHTDQMNPMFITPVFTGLEYVAFRSFGVGTWQARTVPVASGMIAIAALMAGLWVAAGRWAAVIGGILLATNYTFVMWNRAALVESTMVACVAVGWAAYALAERRTGWGFVAGAAAVLAFFTKASAAFFIAALAVEVLTALLGPRQGRAAAKWALAGLALAGLVAAIAFVLPFWTEFRFYNWQVSVTRKPDYSLRAILDRASWLPLTHGIFMRMWLVLVTAAIGTAAIAARWRNARPAERLAVLWLVVGLLEIVAHDAGNERRFVMLVPAMIAIASITLVREWPHIAPELAGRVRWLQLPIVAVFSYLLAGTAVRLWLFREVEAGSFSTAVRVSAAIAAVVAAVFWWRAHRRALGAPRSAPHAGFRTPRVLIVAVILVTCGTDLWLYARWARSHTTFNYDASVAVGKLLAPGTLVQGKLANGLALENQIRPLFIGQGYGNYDDRLSRDDVRYLLTYSLPTEGYETPGGLIRQLLDHYPNRRVIATFDVDETPGIDRAELIDKFPATRSGPPHERD